MVDIEAKRIARTGQLTILLVFGGLAAWLATAPLNGAVVVAGSVKVDANRKTIQHSEGGIVKTILVRDGDRVSAGQPLVELQDSQVAAAYSVLRNALDGELARQSRLRSEAVGAPAVTFADELSVAAKPRAWPRSWPGNRVCFAPGVPRWTSRSG